jgi:hypothetical protein
MKSLPSATGSMCVASATAAPPLLPPADFVRSNALRVTPKTSLNVCEPRPNSGVLVLPTTMQPAAFIRSTISASWSGTWSASSGEPSVLGIPFVSAASLIACGMPCIQPRLWPRASAASRASAWRSRSTSSCRLTIAFTCGLTAAMRSSVARMTSRHDTSLAWMARESASASRSVIVTGGFLSRKRTISASRTSSGARSPT